VNVFYTHRMRTLTRGILLLLHPYLASRFRSFGATNEPKIFQLGPQDIATDTEQASGLHLIILAIAIRRTHDGLGQGVK
jgi:hypothetical protein